MIFLKSFQIKKYFDPNQQACAIIPLKPFIAIEKGLQPNF
jgi:hypothetical protein